MNDFFGGLGVGIPLIQAPMAGVSTPALAAAVTEAGALGSIAIGALSHDQARAEIEAVRALTAGPFAVNVFCHRPPIRNSAREADWLRALAPAFARLGAAAPTQLREPYRSFLEDPEMLELVCELRPAVLSVHFGLPPAAAIARLRASGVRIVASVTRLEEGEQAVAAGADAVVAQGWEAGGHRGMFDPALPDPGLGALPLTRLLARRLPVPVIAAGGLMDGAAIAAALVLGAAGAQLGTAFLLCPEAATDPRHRAGLRGPGVLGTVMTRAISGRPARGLPNDFSRLGQGLSDAPPDYPVAYDAGKALAAAARAVGDGGFAAQWAGQGAPLARSLPAAELVRTLEREIVEARATL